MDKPIVNLALSEYQPVSAAERTDRGGWVAYGKDNLFPQYLNELAETSPVHGSLTISISDMIAGKGLTSNAQERVDALDLYSAYYSASYDYKKYGGFYLEIIYTNDRQNIAKVNHLPFQECRLAVEGEDETVIGIYHSEDWANIRKKKNKPTFIPKFHPASAVNETKQVYFCYNYTSGQFYPRPDYWSAVNYIELERQVGIYHVNNILNGLFPSFIISFFNGQVEPQQQIDIKRDWERLLTGAKNAGKFLMTFNERDTPKPEIESFPLSDADKQYQFLSEESTNKVMIAHRITTPLLFGIRSQTGFGSNKDEMQVGLEIFTNQVIEPAQRKIINGFTEILSFEIPTIEMAVIPNTPLGTATPQSTEPQQLKKKVLAEDSFEPTNEMAAEAELGLKWRDEYGRGGTEVGVARARDISNKRNLSLDTVKRMNSYFARHEVDKQATGWNDGEEGFPTAGRIAWQLWGGDPGQAWAARIVSSLDLSKIDMTKEDESAWLEHLATKGEYMDPEEWELIDEREAGSHEEALKDEAMFRGVALGLEQYENAGDKSQWGDTGLYKLRYAYSQNLSDNSRDFCIEMVGLSRKNIVFRYEDIKAMGDAGENGQFAPEGQSTYDIFVWKGGCFCHHKWLRRIYFRKRKNGKFLPNDGLKNDQRVGNNPFVPQKGPEGIAPIDTPSRGSLKYS